MKQLMTEAQLLHEWQLRTLPETASTSVDIELDDGIEAMLKARMEDWYHDLVLNGAAEMLYPTEIVDRCTVEVGEESTTVYLPADTVRILRVRVAGGEREAMLTTEGDSRLARLQASPYTRGTLSYPVALHSRETGILTLYPAAEPESVMAVADTPGTYALDTAALSTIKPIFP